MRAHPSKSSFAAIVALVLAATPAFARGGGGGGHGGGGGGHGGGGGGHTGGHGGGGHVGGTPHVGGAFVGGSGVYIAPRTYGAYGGWGGESYGLRHDMGDVRFGPFGGLFGGYLYVGPNTIWLDEAHWGNGFWASGPDGWSWYTGPWWVSPAYPGWVWIGPPWVWDGQRMISKEGYWTTAAMPTDGEAPAFVDHE